MQQQHELLCRESKKVFSNEKNPLRRRDTSSILNSFPVAASSTIKTIPANASFDRAFLRPLKPHHPSKIEPFSFRIAAMLDKRLTERCLRRNLCETLSCHLPEAGPCGRGEDGDRFQEAQFNQLE